tara:strand:+ start:6983 stop:7924 length:942 start_codon:yes stop_codon:yes gene_type:complete
MGEERFKDFKDWIDNGPQTDMGAEFSISLRKEEEKERKRTLRGRKKERGTKVKSQMGSLFEGCGPGTYIGRNKEEIKFKEPDFKGRYESLKPIKRLPGILTEFSKDERNFVDVILPGTCAIELMFGRGIYSKDPNWYIMRELDLKRRLDFICYLGKSLVRFEKINVGVDPTKTRDKRSAINKYRFRKLEENPMYLEKFREDLGSLFFKMVGDGRPSLFPISKEKNFSLPIAKDSINGVGRQCPWIRKELAERYEKGYQRGDLPFNKNSALNTKFLYFAERDVLGVREAQHAGVSYMRTLVMAVTSWKEVTEEE